MSLSIRPLTPELAAKAAKELNEDPDKLADEVKALREWISEQPHLHARTDDQFLVAFLRGCRHDLEAAKEKIDLCFALRTALPEFLSTEDPTSPRTLELLRMGVVLPLPKTATPDGPRIVFMRFGDPNSYNMFEICRIQNMIYSILLKDDDHITVAGQLGFVDTKGVTANHFAPFNMRRIRKCALFTQEASPIRIVGAHYINAPGFFESFFGLFRKFFSDDLNNRVSSLGN